MSTKITLQLSKEEVISKLENLSFPFKESYWDDFQQTHNSVKYAQPSTPSKISAKLIAIPLVVIVAGFIVYYSINNLQSQNNSAISHESKPVQQTTPAAELKQDVAAPVVTKEEIKNEAVVPAASVSVPQINNPQPVVVKQENAVVDSNKPAETNQIKAARVVNTVVPSQNASMDSGATVNVPVKKNNDVQSGRKKRKGDKKLATPVLMPSPEEDNIIVPEN